MQTCGRDCGWWRRGPTCTARVPVMLGMMALWLAGAAAAGQAADVRVGFGKVEVTPELSDDRPVYIAGYGQNRRATGVHDPLYARAVVLDDGQRRVAMVAVDVVGLFYPETQAVREALPGFDYVLVAATHNHEGPDTMGLWGPTPFKSGVDAEYMRTLRERIVEAVRQAAEQTKPAKGVYGTAQDDTLLRDSRLPIAYDGVIRVVRFARPGSGEAMGLLVQWSCHPEAMDSANTEITADFPFALVRTLEEKYQCPVVYFSGAVGGLMAPPRNGCVRDAAGNELKQGTFEYTETYGRMVAELAVKAIESGTLLELAPLAISAQRIAVPLANRLYMMAARMGVLKRPSRAWTGDFRTLGELQSPRKMKHPPALETEVAYLRLGQLHVACIPGELYPELVYGTFQEPADPGADFADAPLEPTVTELMPGDRFLLVGLANDELGYIVPKRQWDEQPPFAYGRKKMQYGEVNSLGPETAPILMQALRQCVQEANAKAP